MFNLNDASLGEGITIFNNGNPGKVKNVTMSVTKKESGDHEQAPDYKLIFTETSGASVNTGFYYFVPKSDKSDVENLKSEGYLISRLLSAARAVVPMDFVFPEVANSKEAIDSLCKIIKEHGPNKKVNVYVTYGTKERPNNKGYLGVRYFDFVESADTPDEKSRLRAHPRDLMEKILPDAPIQESTNKSW